MQSVDNTALYRDAVWHTRCSPWAHPRGEACAICARLRETIVRTAREWLGTPFRHAAAVKGHGVDCGRFLLEVYHAAGLIPAIDPRPYPKHWFLRSDDTRYLNLLREYAEATEDHAPGNIALYRVGRAEGHGAIIIEWPTVIHAHPDYGVVEQDGERNVFRGELSGFWRVRGL
jgi:cell wall-associated NlpC family hydrolase